MGPHFQFAPSAHNLARSTTTTAGTTRANPTDYPVATTENHSSTYVGGQVSFAANYKQNDLQAGFVRFHQHDSQLFGILFNARQRRSQLSHS